MISKLVTALNPVAILKRVRDLAPEVSEEQRKEYYDEEELKGGTIVGIYSSPFVAIKRYFSNHSKKA